MSSANLVALPRNCSCRQKKRDVGLLLDPFGPAAISLTDVIQTWRPSADSVKRTSASSCQPLNDTSYDAGPPAAFVMESKRPAGDGFSISRISSRPVNLDVSLFSTTTQSEKMRKTPARSSSSDGRKGGGISVKSTAVISLPFGSSPLGQSSIMYRSR